MGNIRDQARAVSSLSSAALINAALAMGVGVMMARFLGPAGQGIMTFSTTIAALVSLLAGSGSGPQLRVMSRGLPSRENVRAYLGLVTLIAPGAGVATGLLVLAFGPTPTFSICLLSTIYGFSLSLARQHADLVQAYGYPARSVLSVAVGTCGQGVLFAGAIALARQSPEVALLCGAAGSLIQVVASRQYLSDLRVPWTPKRNVRVWRTLLLGGVPSLGFYIGLLALQRVDRIILIAISGPAVGGRYAAAATLAEASRLLPQTIGQLLFVRTAESGSYSYHLRPIYRFGAILQLLGLVGGLLLAGWAVSVLFGSKYAGADSYLRGLLVAEFFMGFALMDARIIMGYGRFKEIGALTLGLALLALPTYYVLIQVEGAEGAIAATCMLYTIFAASLFVRRTWLVRNERERLAE